MQDRLYNLYQLWGQNIQGTQYLELDCNRMSDKQHKLLIRTGYDSLTTYEVYMAMQNEGIFGILSNENYICEDILPAYYQHQSAKQIFDFAKNYTKLPSLRTNTEATINGHLRLSYIVACTVKMILLCFKGSQPVFRSAACLFAESKMYGL